MILTVSPRSKRPTDRVTPAGSRLLPPIQARTILDALQRMLESPLRDAQMTPRPHRDFGRGDLGLHPARSHIADDAARHRFDLRGDFEYAGDELGIGVRLRIRRIQPVD